MFECGSHVADDETTVDILHKNSVGQVVYHSTKQITFCRQCLFCQPAIGEFLFSLGDIANGDHASPDATGVIPERLSVATQPDSFRSPLVSQKDLNPVHRFTS